MANEDGRAVGASHSQQGTPASPVNLTALPSSSSTNGSDRLSSAAGFPTIVAVASGSHQGANAAGPARHPPSSGSSSPIVDNGSAAGAIFGKGSPFAARRDPTPLSVLSPPTSSTTFSPGGASLLMSPSVGIAPDEIPMLASTSRATFAPSGELLIDGLGVDGRDLSKGELGWAEPFAPTLVVTPTTRRFSTRPSQDPAGVGAASATGFGLSPAYASPPTLHVPLPDGGESALFASDNFGACTAQGCGSSVTDQARDGANGIGSITIHDIIERRTCRPVSLQDLRAHLLAQRAERKKGASSSTKKTPQLPDLSLLGGATKVRPNNSTDWGNKDRDPEKTLTNSMASAMGPLRQPSKPSTSATKMKLKKRMNKSRRSATSGDDVDALDFVAVFNRYNRRFRALPRSQQLRSPNPALFTPQSEDDGPSMPMGPSETRQSSTRTSREVEGAITVEVTVRGGPSTRSRPGSRLGQTGSVDAHPVSMRKELTVFPASQPLRDQFDEILSRFLGLGTTAGGHKGLPEKREGEADQSQDLEMRSGSARLSWMVDIGLISEEQITATLVEAELSTHPQVLAPLVDKVAVYLNDHIVPDFLNASTSNLSKGTQLGRLAVGIACTALAILFTVLLVINPSPFAPRARREGGPNPTQPDVPRWWRLLTAPLWCAGIGYVLAAWTGVCVWLTIRGNHEPGEEPSAELMTEAEWETLMLEGDVDGTGSAPPNGATMSVGDPALPWRRADRKTLLAPELVNLLRRAAFLQPLPVAGLASSRHQNSRHSASGASNSSTESAKGMSFSKLSWTAAALPDHQRREKADSHLHRMISTTVPGVGNKLRPLNESASGAVHASLRSPPAAVLSSGSQTASVSMLNPPVTPQMPSSAGTFVSQHGFSPKDRAPETSPNSPSLSVMPPVSPSTAGASQSPPGGRTLGVVAPVSLKSKKVPVLPVTVNIVMSHNATSAQGPESTSARGSFARHSQSQAVLPTIHSIEMSAGGAPWFIQQPEGIAYAASLYDVNTCAPRRQPPPRFLSALWVGIRRWTGFAVDTKPVLDARVRAAQQRAAMQSLLICFGATAAVLILITALP